MPTAVFRTSVLTYLLLTAPQTSPAGSRQSGLHRYCMFTDIRTKPHTWQMIILCLTYLLHSRYSHDKNIDSLLQRAHSLSLCFLHKPRLRHPP